ncbi:hypothetical protein HK405_015048 [Cladochytrium tenue]|nr:hypothetical protein HK405_015048 [Cladochytrium tenue]
MATSAAADSVRAALNRAAALLLDELDGGADVRRARAAVPGMDPSHLRGMVRGLLVQRPPSATATDDSTLFDAMDDVLAWELSRTVVTDPASWAAPAAAAADNGGADGVRGRVRLWKGDITTLRATAIVNAANTNLLGCFDPRHRCVDNVIHSRAGPRLRAACADLHGLPLRPGDARVTPGFGLPCELVVHTVGPEIKRGRTPTVEEEGQLRSCYWNSLDLVLSTLAAERRSTLTSVAFPCISTGLFGFPARRAVEIACEAVFGWLEAHPEASNWVVIFNTFLQSDHDLYERHLSDAYHLVAIPPTITSNPLLDAAASAIRDADFLLVTGGAGLSAAAGLDYTSEAVFERHHKPMHSRGFRNMYQFIGFDSWTPELQWGYLFKQTWLARFEWTKHRTAPTYTLLKDIYDAKPAGRRFVRTSNADGMFAQEGFPLDEIYTVQGDYGNLQCLSLCSGDSVWPSKPYVERGLPFVDPATYELTDSSLVPTCPRCGGKMSLNVNGGRWFNQTPYRTQQAAYEQWIEGVMQKVRTGAATLAIIEIGCGWNTPTVIRIPNETLATHPGVTLIRVNQDHYNFACNVNGVAVPLDANEALLSFSASVGPGEFR